MTTHPLNRAVAIALCVLMVGFGVLIGKARHVSRLYDDAATAGASVAADIEARAQQAHNLVAVAARYYPPDHAQTGQVRDAADRLVKYRTFNDAHAVNTELSERVADLMKLLRAFGMSERDEGYVSNIENELKSADRRIAYSGYNDLARAFNRERLWQKPLALFE